MQSSTKIHCALLCTRTEISHHLSTAVEESVAYPSGMDNSLQCSTASVREAAAAARTVSHGVVVLRKSWIHHFVLHIALSHSVTQ